MTIAFPSGEDAKLSGFWLALTRVLAGVGLLAALILLIAQITGRSVETNDLTITVVVGAIVGTVYALVAARRPAEAGDDQPTLTQALGTELARSRRFQSPLAILYMFIATSELIGDPSSSKNLSTSPSRDILKAKLRAYDLVFPDEGGRHFFVVLPEADLAGAGAVKLRLEKIARENGWGRISWGAAAFPADGDGVEFLVEKAKREARLAGQSIGPTSP